MGLRAFKSIPKDLIEWSRYLTSLVIEPDPGSVGADQLKDGSVTFQKIQDVTTGRLIGRYASPAGTAQEVSVGGGLELSGSTLGIAPKGVSYPRIQDVSANTVLGRQSPGSGSLEEIACTAAGRALLDDVDATAQRSTLGLGTASTRNTGTSGATVPLLDGVNSHASAQCAAFSVGSATPAGTQAANADTSGATLTDLEAEVNQLKAVLRTFGLIAP